MIKWEEVSRRNGIVFLASPASRLSKVRKIFKRIFYLYVNAHGFHEKLIL